MPYPFPEAAYRAANPDVDQAIIDGNFTSARQHWETFGFFEGRPGVDRGLTPSYVTTYESAESGIAIGGVSPAFFGVGAGEQFFGLQKDQLVNEKSNISEFLEGSGDSGLLNFYDVQRQRTLKFAVSYLQDDARPVSFLNSAGSQIPSPSVIASRRGFQDFRRMQVLTQWWVISRDDAYLQHVKKMMLDWAETHTDFSFIDPATQDLDPITPEKQDAKRLGGHPINQTHMEGMHQALRHLAPYGTQGEFTASEYSVLRDYLLRILRATLKWNFGNNEPGGSILRFGNHITHHLMQLAMCYQSLGKGDKIEDLMNVVDLAGATGTNWDTVDLDTGSYPAHGLSMSTIEGLATMNIPFGNTALQDPTSGDIFDGSGGFATRAPIDLGETIDFIRRDANHYQVYDVQPWVILLDTLRMEKYTYAPSSTVDINRDLAYFIPGDASGGGPASNGTFGASSGTTLVERVDACFDFMWERMWGFGFDDVAIPAYAEHYEFEETNDDFDAGRWAGSNSEYIAPASEWLFDEGAKCSMIYYHYRMNMNAHLQVEINTPDYVGVDPRVVSVAGRGDRMSSDWAYWFRFTIGV